MPPKGFARNETGFIKWIVKKEFSLLLDQADKELHKPMWRSILHLLFYIGLRRGEVARIKWVDIIGDFKRLRVQDIKNHEIRERIIPSKVAFELRIYEFAFRRFQHEGIYVFEPPRQSGSRNKHLNPDSITVKFAKFRKAAGLNDWYFRRKDGGELCRITPHTCRHWFITKVYERSDLITAQRIVGHKKSETTARYIFKNTLQDVERGIVESL